ncbi:hypothetical protein H632_c2875p0, partial [Helicosporidium sp. ATCC 50920]
SHPSKRSASGEAFNPAPAPGWQPKQLPTSSSADLSPTDVLRRNDTQQSVQNCSAISALSDAPGFGERGQRGAETEVDKGSLEGSQERSRQLEFDQTIAAQPSEQAAALQRPEHSASVQKLSHSTSVQQLSHSTAVQQLSQPTSVQQLSQPTSVQRAPLQLQSSHVPHHQQPSRPHARHASRAPSAEPHPPARPLPSTRRQHVPTKSSKAVPTGENGVFTSLYRGVTRHRLTGRFEAHFWDASHKRETRGKGGRTRGRQVYLGGYTSEVEAARAYDIAALAFLGPQAPINYGLDEYGGAMEDIQGLNCDEVVSLLRRGSVGFARGASQYRGVTKHHQHGKWEARIGRVDGSKYLYLGTFESAEEAARAYDRAAVKFRGRKAITNFKITDYADVLAGAQEEQDRLASGVEAGMDMGLGLQSGNLPLSLGSGSVYASQPLLLDKQTAPAYGLHPPASLAAAYSAQELACGFPAPLQLLGFAPSGAEGGSQ